MCVPDTLVEVPVGVGEGRVGRDDAGDGARAQLAVVLSSAAARNLAAAKSAVGERERAAAL